MGKINFLPLIQALKEGHCKKCEGHFVEIVSRLDKVAFIDVLKNAGYTGRLEEKKGLFYISLAPDKWEKPIPISLDFKLWWRSLQNMEKMPDEYFIVHENISSIDSEKHKLIIAAEAVFLFRKFLKLLGDHHLIEENKVLFFINDSEQALKRSISLSVESEDLYKLEEPKPAKNSLSSMVSAIELDDPHNAERKEVFRRTLTKFLDDTNDPEIILLLQKIDKIYEKYKEQYEIYFHNFSVSKLLNEVDQKSLEFNSKLMDFITSSQNKALTIPGSIIAIGALVRSTETAALILVVFGVWMVRKILITSNDVLRKTFDDLEWQIGKSFHKYSSLSNEFEVSDSANKNRSILFEKIYDAKKRLDQVDFLAKMTFIAALIYSSWVIFFHN